MWRKVLAMKSYCLQDVDKYKCDWFKGDSMRARMFQMGSNMELLLCICLSVRPLIVLARDVCAACAHCVCVAALCVHEQKDKSCQVHNGHKVPLEYGWHGETPSHQPNVYIWERNLNACVYENENAHMLQFSRTSETSEFISIIACSRNFLTVTKFWIGCVSVVFLSKWMWASRFYNMRRVTLFRFTALRLHYHRLSIRHEFRQIKMARVVCDGFCFANSHANSPNPFSTQIWASELPIYV